MQRNFSDQGIILKTNPIGEIHRGVTIITRKHGFVHAVAHGAQSKKGKMRGNIGIFVLGMCYFYYEPVKKRYTLRDITVSDYHEEIRQDITRYFHASLWAEVLLKSYGGGGEADKLYALYRTALTAVKKIPLQDIDYLTIQFIWRYLSILGAVGDPQNCVSCGRITDRGEPMFLIPQEQALCCSECKTPNATPLSPGTIRYLAHTGTLSLFSALGIKSDNRTKAELKKVMFLLIENFLEAPINTLKVGEGIV